MPDLRMLLRTAPVLLAVLAACVWLRRRRAARRALAVGPSLPQIEPAPATEVAPINAAPAEEPHQLEPSRRFEREPVDIVTVVDDLLLAGR